MGTTFCGDDGGELSAVVFTEDKAKAGEGVRGKVSEMLLVVADIFEEEISAKLLNREGTTGGSSSLDCCKGVTVPTGMNVFAIDTNGRYGVTVVIGLVTVFGGDGMWLVLPADDIVIIPLASFSKFRKSSVSFVLRRDKP